jgi:hypothetical protein
MVDEQRRDERGRMTKTAPALDRFHGGCWDWTGGRTGAGYGAFYPTSKQVLAHIWAYQNLVGLIPASQVIDHLCRNRGCVNPEHLEPTSRGDNVLRSPVSNAGANARKTTCDRGHPLSGDNLVIAKNARNPDLPPWRNCRTCRNDKRRERRRAARQAE